MQICKQCNYSSADDAAFCGNCGSLFAKSEMPSQEQAKACPNCGTEITAGQKFCSGCGTSTVAAEHPAPSHLTHCPNCSIEVTPGSKFCPGCGKSLVADSATAMPAAPPTIEPQAPPVGQPQPIYQSLPPTKKPVWPWVVGGLVCLGCICPVILAAILFPVFEQAKRAAKSTVSLSDAKQVDLAMLMYTSDYDDYYPALSDAANVAVLIQPYLKNQHLSNVASGYDWNQALSLQSATSVADPKSTWVFTSKEPDPLAKYDVGFADGHAKAVLQDELSQIKASSKSPPAAEAWDIHKVWDLPAGFQGVSKDGHVQIDFTDNSNYRGIMLDKVPQAPQTQMLVIVEGTYSYTPTGSVLTINKGSTLRVYTKASTGTSWANITDAWISVVKPEGKETVLKMFTDLTEADIRDKPPVSEDQVIREPSQ